MFTVRHFFPDFDSFFGNTSVQWNETISVNETILWNSFCDKNTYQVCTQTKIKNCSGCSQFSFWMFFAFALFLALIILGGNLLVLVYVYTSERTGYGIVRASLAVAEIQTSILLFSTTLPNIVWTLNSTPMEIFAEVQNSVDSVYAEISGVYLMFCTTSFLFSLTFLSYIHYAAVKWPIAIKSQSKRKLCYKVMFMWFLATVPPTYPCWFPRTFQFSYNYYCFIFLPGVEKDAASLEHGFIFIALLFPAYILMTYFTVATIVLIRQSSKLRRQMSSMRYVHQIRIEQRSSCILLTFLEVVFTITLLPSVLAYLVYILSDENTTTVLICNYLTMCNGLLNLVIFSWKDRKFKRFLKNSIKKWKNKFGVICQKNEESHKRVSEIYQLSTTVQVSITKF